MIRAALPAETPALAHLRRRWRLERHDEGSEPVGMLLMFVHERMPEPDRKTGRWGYVGNVFVLPEHRDAGVGGRLLDAAVAHADAHGFVRVMLNPTPRSVPFYERAGFGRDHPLLVRE